MFSVQMKILLCFLPSAHLVTDRGCVWGRRKGEEEVEREGRQNIQETMKKREQVRESSEILRNTQKIWETMGTQTMKGSGWDLKKIKRIETEGEQKKSPKLTWQQNFHVQIKSYCKKQEEERTKNYEMRSEEEDDSRGLRTEEGQQPRGDIR